ncbi:hypothetical protein JCM21900_005797 [Sporobolomyces salmonicolor]
MAVKHTLASDLSSMTVLQPSEYTKHFLSGIFSDAVDFLRSALLSYFLTLIPPAKFLAPASWRRFHLSELIHEVLENDSPTTFAFSIDPAVKRSSLRAHCAASGTSEEALLDVEFLPSTLPPQLESTLPSEDWVSDVFVSSRGAILHAGTLSLQASAFPPPSTLTLAGHDLSAFFVTYVSHPLGSEDNKHWFASGGMDRVGRVWEYTIPPLSMTAETALAAPKTISTLSLHQVPTSSVRSGPCPSPRPPPTSSPHLLTASWDGLIGVWDLTPGSPVSVIRGHTNKGSRAVFDRHDVTKAYSAESSSKSSDKVLLDLAELAAPNLLATGSPDRLICLWDLRWDATQDILPPLSGHTAPVPAIAAHPTSSLLCASGSYDSTVRSWDARSATQALFRLEVVAWRVNGQESKVPAAA